MSTFLPRAIGVVVATCAIWAVAAPAPALGPAAAGAPVSGGDARTLPQVERELAAKPKDAHLRFERGVLLMREHRIDDAQRVFSDLARDYPDMPEAYNNIAVIHAGRGEYEQAREALESALRARPSYAVALENLGDVHVQLALSDYTRALQLEPASATIPAKLTLLHELLQPIRLAPAADAPPVH